MKPRITIISSTSTCLSKRRRVTLLLHASYGLTVLLLLLLCNTCMGSSEAAVLSSSSSSPTRSPSSSVSYYPSHIKLRAAVLHSPPYAFVEEQENEDEEDTNSTIKNATTLFHGLQLDLLERIQQLAAQDDGVKLEVELMMTTSSSTSSYDAALDIIANDCPLMNSSSSSSSSNECNQFDLIIGDYSVSADRSMRVDFTPPWNNPYHAWWEPLLVLEAQEASSRDDEEASQHMMMMAWPMSYSLPPLTARLMKKWMYTIVTNRTAMEELYHPYVVVSGDDEKEETLPQKETVITIIAEDSASSEGGSDQEEVSTTTTIAMDTIPLAALNDGEYNNEEESSSGAPGAWKGVAYGMLGINVVVILICTIWTWIYRHSVEVRASQPFFMILVLVGCLLSSFSILALTRASAEQSTPALGSDEDNNNLHGGCMAIPWLYSIGFCITYGTLYAKILRIYTIFTQASNFQLSKLRSYYSTSFTQSTMASAAADVRPMDSSSSIVAMAGLRHLRTAAGGGGGGMSLAHVSWDPVNFGETIMVIAIVLAIDICILVVWTVIDPLTYQQYDDDYDGFGNDGYGGYCTSDHWQIFTTVIGCYHLILLALTSYMCFKARQIPRRYSESKDVSMAIMSNLQIFAVGIPILIIVSGEPSASLFVKSAMIWMNDLSVVVILFSNLMWSLHVSSKKNDSAIDRLKMKNAVRHYSQDGTQEAKSIVQGSNHLTHHYSLEEEDLTTTQQGSNPNINTGGWLHELMGSGASNDDDDDAGHAGDHGSSPTTKNKNKQDNISSTTTPTATPPTRKQRRSLRVSSLAMGSAFGASDFDSSSDSGSDTSSDSEMNDDDHLPLPATAKEPREKTVSWGMVSFSEVECNEDGEGSSAPFALGNPQFYNDHSVANGSSKRFGEACLAQAAPRTPPRRRRSIGSSEDNSRDNDDDDDEEDDDEIDIQECPCPSESKEEEEEEEEEEITPFSNTPSANDAPRRPLRLGSEEFDIPLATQTVVKHKQTKTMNSTVTNRSSIPPRQPSRLASTVEAVSEEFDLV